MPAWAPVLRPPLPILLSWLVGVGVMLVLVSLSGVMSVGGGALELTLGSASCDPDTERDASAESSDAEEMAEARKVLNSETRDALNSAVGAEAGADFGEDVVDLGGRVLDIVVSDVVGSSLSSMTVPATTKAPPPLSDVVLLVVAADTAEETVPTAMDVLDIVIPTISAIESSVGVPVTTPSELVCVR